MWWNEQDKRWEPHPDCTCGQPWGYCICPPFSLDPLDAQGKPIKGTIIEKIRDGLNDPDHLNPAKGGNRASDDYW